MTGAEGVPLEIVDAFAAGPFTGNPAAVCLLDGPAPAAWMQAVAAETNLSETAFLWPRGGAWSLRWFTPLREVDLCGHATLAAAHVLAGRGALGAAGAARFRTRGGTLTARVAGERVELDFPAVPVTPAAPPPPLRSLLGAEPVYVGTSAVGLVALLDSPAPVRALRGGDPRIAEVDPYALVVSAPGGPGDGADVVSRVFLPNAGIAEDPVTGSAHCALGPLWSARLGRRVLRCRQLSPRGGALEVRPAGDRVLLAGGVHTVLRGVVVVPVAHDPGALRAAGGRE
ncbi:MAG TPA: PhzF family phenazine biosynthesis protein [Miltoncostaeaceae bacterium]|nr:PhzF family phenazine biosynthesis protein [Miltoncostaeaceae bacterium]